MKLGLIQIRGNCGSRGRFSTLVSRIWSAARSGARVIVLPELFLHAYFPQWKRPSGFRLAHTLENPQMIHLQSLSGELEAVLVVPFFERGAEGRFYNSCVLFDADGSSPGLYRKAHIPCDPGFYETYYFSPGDLGFRVFGTRYGRIGVLICWDQWFPEAARLTALQGSDVIVCPSAIGWDRREVGKRRGRARKILKEEELSAWKTVQKGNAISNGVFWAAVNRVGVEKDLEFWGHSFVYGPFGRVLGELGPREEKTLIVELDPAQVKNTRSAWTFLRDRRPGMYKELSQRYE